MGDSGKRYRSRSRSRSRSPLKSTLHTSTAPTLSVSNLDNTLYMNDFPLDYPTFCDGYETSKNDILPWDSIDGYFSNYADIDIESGNVEEKREGKEEETDKNNIVELTITSLRVDSNDGDDDYDYVEI